MEHRNDTISKIFRGMYYSWIFSRLPKRNYSILDVGGGTGKFSQWAKSKGYIVTSIDPEPQKEWILPLKIEEIPLREQFDVVWCSHVLEHQKNHQEFAQNLFQHTRKYLIVTAPLPTKDFWDEPTHVRPWTREGLLRLFSFMKPVFSWETSIPKIMHTCGVVFQGGYWKRKKGKRKASGMNMSTFPV